MQAAGSNNHWKDLARQWNRLASPLRPHEEDLRILHHALEATGDSKLILGVTPEFAALPGQLVAVDRNAAMIGGVWPGNGPQRHAIRADWLRLPFAPCSFDAVVGDGSLSQLAYPAQYVRLLDQLGSVMRPRGRLILRLYVGPDRPETPQAVLDDAMNARVGSFPACKFRLAMSIASSSENNDVSVPDILNTFNALVPDRKKLAEAAGWNLDDIATIDAYRTSVTRYSFPILDRILSLIPRRFSVAALAYGSYELARRCPTLVLDLTP